MKHTISLEAFVDQYGHRMRPPATGWRDGTWVRCAIRSKDNSDYVPELRCYVHVERNKVYLLQTECRGTTPLIWPSAIPRGNYSWTILDGSAGSMQAENVAYLGPGEGRNKL